MWELHHEISRIVVFVNNICNSFNVCPKPKSVINSVSNWISIFFNLQILMKFPWGNISIKNIRFNYFYQTSGLSKLESVLFLTSVITQEVVTWDLNFHHQLSTSPKLRKKWMFMRHYCIFLSEALYFCIYPHLRVKRSLYIKLDYFTYTLIVSQLLTCILIWTSGLKIDQWFYNTRPVGRCKLALNYIFCLVSF